MLVPIRNRIFAAARKSSKDLAKSNSIPTFALTQTLKEQSLRNSTFCWHTSRIILRVLGCSWIQAKLLPFTLLAYSNMLYGVVCTKAHTLLFVCMFVPSKMFILLSHSITLLRLLDKGFSDYPIHLFLSWYWK